MRKIRINGLLTLLIFREMTYRRGVPPWITEADSLY